MDRRHVRRQHIVQELFAHAFTSDFNETEVSDRTRAVLDHIQQIDPFITRYAQKYDIESIARVDLAVLRLAIYELLFQKEKEVPPKVIINEAVELAKEMGGEKSPSFINAVLGKVYEESEIQS